MVTEKTSHIIFICDVCGFEYVSEQCAKQCEKQLTINSQLIWNNHSSNKWKVGDIMFILEYDDFDEDTKFTITLGEIINTRIEKHLILPIIKNINNNDTLIIDHNDSNVNAFVLDDYNLKMLCNITRII